LILQHSTTGNTRLVARYTADRLTALGWDVERWDIVKRPEPPDPAEVDLLGVASPTMYFRQTVAMERFLARLPALAAGRRPAFLVGTCAGIPGAHYPQQASQLAAKGWVALGARWLIFPTNWPPHRRAIRPFEPTAFAGAALGRWLPDLRPLWGLFWEAATEPTATDRDGLGRFLDEVDRQARGPELGAAPDPGRLARSVVPFAAMGERMEPRMMVKATQIRIDPAACTRCGTCVGLCPSGCLSRASDEDVPLVGDGCTGCWSCYNHCPDRAIAGWFSPAGAACYGGPSPATRALFRTSNTAASTSS